MESSVGGGLRPKIQKIQKIKKSKKRNVVLYSHTDLDLTELDFLPPSPLFENDACRKKKKKKITKKKPPPRL